MRFQSKLSLYAAVCVLLAAAVSTRGQEPTGIISGAITDSSGAVVPNVTITITNKATGAARIATANAEGLYSAAALFPADYEVRVEQAGFRTVVAAAQVVAGGTTSLDLTIVPGAPAEVVKVEAAAAQVDYDSHTIQGVIQRQTIEDLPLNGRSSLQLASLEPGVTQVPGSIAQFNAMFNVSVFGSTAGAGSGSGGRSTFDGRRGNHQRRDGRRHVHEFVTGPGAGVPALHSEFRCLHGHRSFRRHQHHHEVRQQ